MKPVTLVVGEDSTVPFDRWLATRLTVVLERAVPRGLARKAIVAGFVAVGGRLERNPALLLRRGRSVFIRRLDWLPRPDPGTRLRILYEDESVLVVDKPPGLPTHETKDPDRESLTQLVERHAGRRLFVHHRLDAATSGLVLFAKVPEANAALARSFAERQVKKVYAVLVRRPLADCPDEMVINGAIRVLANGSVRVDPGGSEATTAVRVLARYPDRLLVEARPVTGRKHQIRVHLASMGAPILGDLKYGGPASSTGRLMLHAETIELEHPTTGRRLVVSSPRPEEFHTGRAEARLGRRPAGEGAAIAAESRLGNGGARARATRSGPGVEPARKRATGSGRNRND